MPDDQELAKQREKEALQEQITKELADTERKHGEMAPFFNNFRANLKQSYLVEENPNDMVRQGLEKDKAWDVPRGQSMKPDDPARPKHSELYLQQSPAQYYQTLRELV